MDWVNIVDAAGHVLGTNIPFVRAPVSGEFIAGPKGWLQVTGVAHMWSGTTPGLTIRVAVPASAAFAHEASSSFSS